MPTPKLTIALLLLCTALFAQQKGTLTDTRDGKTYKTTKIGEQVWMAENLNYKAKDSKCYGEGGKVSNRENGNFRTLSKAEIQTNCGKYGRLYKWEAAMKACPSGWHLPDSLEWKILTATVGYSEYFKAVSGWNDNNGKSGNGDDRFSFSALPGGTGVSDFDGSFIFHDVGYYGYWWSASKNTLDAYHLEMNYGHEEVRYHSYRWNSRHLYSVRCIQGLELSQTEKTPDDPISVPKFPNVREKKGTLTDTRDGKTYKTVKIGEQVWMAENLNYKVEGSKCYYDSTTYCDKYGRLYDWYMAVKACPSGWHLSTNDEWDKLYRYVDGTKGTSSNYESKTAGKFLKAKNGWNINEYTKLSGGGADSYGFSALPGGYCEDSDDFLYGRKRYFQRVGEAGYWWSSCEFGSSTSCYRAMTNLGNSAGWSSIGKGGYFYSVRCVYSTPHHPPKGSAK